MSPATSLSPIQTLDREKPPSLRHGRVRNEAPQHGGVRGSQTNTWPHEAGVPVHRADPSLVLMELVSSPRRDQRGRCFSALAPTHPES